MSVVLIKNDDDDDMLSCMAFWCKLCDITPNQLQDDGALNFVQFFWTTR